MITSNPYAFICPSLNNNELIASIVVTVASEQCSLHLGPNKNLAFPNECPTAFKKAESLTEIEPETLSKCSPKPFGFLTTTWFNEMFLTHWKNRVALDSALLSGMFVPQDSKPMFLRWISLEFKNMKLPLYN